ncbi:hypothetical protein FKM82_004685 [Ascaphus truei]
MAGYPHIRYISSGLDGRSFRVPFRGNFEELIHLEERLGNVNRGASQGTIERCTYPHKYKKVRRAIITKLAFLVSSVLTHSLRLVPATRLSRQNKCFVAAVGAYSAQLYQKSGTDCYLIFFFWRWSPVAANQELLRSSAFPLYDVADLVASDVA